MPSGPYPTAFDSTRPAVVSASISGRTVQRPPSPAPSYHTLPPQTHTSIASSQPPGIAQGIPASLLAAAQNTPDAILSTLTLTNHTTPLARHHLTGAAGGVARHLSARTKDGRERYRVGSVEGGIESTVWRDAGSHGARSLDSDSSREVLACLRGGSQALSVFMSTGGRQWKKDALVNLDYDSVQKTGDLELPMLTIEGKDVGLHWEVTTLADFPSTSSNVSLEDSTADGRRRSPKDPLRRTSGLDTHEQKRVQAGLSSLHLVDTDCNVYADYSHDVGLPDLYKDGEVWGEMRVKARSVLIDINGRPGGVLSEKMDRVFLTLVLLLEAYVRVLGGNKRADRNWGNLSATTGCSLM